MDKNQLRIGLFIGLIVTTFGSAIMVAKHIGQVETTTQHIFVLFGFIIVMLACAMLVLTKGEVKSSALATFAGLIAAISAFLITDNGMLTIFPVVYALAAAASVAVAKPAAVEELIEDES